VLRHWFDAHRATVALVRPDRYTYGTAPSWGEGLELLRKWKASLAPVE
jgi:hypothetical protein